MTALPIMILVLCALAIGYRYYSAFLAAKVCVLDDSRVTPAYRLEDGQNYQPMSRWVLFGHHFAAISGAGPLIGPVLAAQFGYLPGLLWLVVGVVLAGAVQDFVVLVASTRRDGKSLAQIVRMEIGAIAGLAAAITILFVLVIALAGLGIVVVNALSESPWGVFTIAMTIPIALVMGVITRWRGGDYTLATMIGVAALLASVAGGSAVANSSLAGYFTLTRNEVTVAMGIYGFVASVLPVWLLLCPRDYLSSFMKIGTIGCLVVGVLLVNPEMRLPALTPYIHGGGPIIPGKVFPFVFITIMCGAVSGFHALVASGTTPKMISRESDCRVIGYGCMLIEGLVGVVALIAVSNLAPGDYFAINVPSAKYAELKLFGYHIEELPVLEAAVREKVEGRTGGAVSLALGMAKIFGQIPGLKGLMAYWYHFAIMFEALFILTTIDAGTRIARFVLQEFLGKVYAPWERPDSVSGTIFTSAVTVLAWSYFIYTGSIATIWPMFGVANQLLAVIGLCVGTTILFNSGKSRYAWVTLAPMCFVAVTTVCGAVELMRDPFWQWTRSGDTAVVVRGYLNIGLTLLMLVCLAVILSEAFRRWRRRPSALGSPRPLPAIDISRERT